MIYRFIKIAGVFLLAVIALSACSTSELQRGESTTEVSIGYLKSLYRSQPQIIDQDVAIRGVVVSSDRSGNIRNSLYVEDKTGAIEIRIDNQRLFEKYPLGDEVRIVCNSLYLGSYGGAIQLGLKSLDGLYETSPISEERIAKIIYSLGSQKAPTPRQLAIGELEHSDIGRFVHFDQVQFISEELMSAWCDYEKSTDRHVVDANNDTLIVRTNYRCLFAYEILPNGSGYIQGVMGYFNGSFQLIVPFHHNVDMEQSRF